VGPKGSCKKTKLSCLLACRRKKASSPFSLFEEESVALSSILLQAERLKERRPFLKEGRKEGRKEGPSLSNSLSLFLGEGTSLALAEQKERRKEKDGTSFSEFPSLS